MKYSILSAGETFPYVNVKTQDGGVIPLVDVKPQVASGAWILVIVYRGQHCPICLKYLNEFSMFSGRFQSLNVNIVAVSADNKQQLDQFKVNGLNVDFPVLLELQVEDMKKLGLYISKPTSDAETDHLFAEPGLFLVNPKGQTAILEVANAPFIRPNIDQFLTGLEYAFQNDYPI